LIRCTAKLIREMGLGKADLDAGKSPSESGLGVWYANLFYIERRKCVIFTNAPTLFSLISFNVRRPEIRDIAGLFRKGLEQALRDERFSNEAIRRVLFETGEIQFDRTADRSLLGVMVDRVKITQYFAWHGGGLEKCDRVDIVRRLNRIPMSTIGFCYSIEKFSRVLGEPKDGRDLE